MIAIPLGLRAKPENQGWAVVDDVDADLAGLRWCVKRGHNTIYAIHFCPLDANGKQEKIYIHRLILGRILGRPLAKGEHVDHIDRDGCDNRRSNLRLATNSQNMGNQVSRTGTSKYKGVSWHKAKAKWHAYIRLDGRTRHLSYFTDEAAAARAYDEAARELFGEFARKNFPQEVRDA